MGFSSISPLSLLLIFFIAVLLFGSKRLSQLGRDLGQAISGFNQGLKEKDTEQKSDSHIAKDD